MRSPASNSKTRGSERSFSIQAAGQEPWGLSRKICWSPTQPLREESLACWAYSVDIVRRLCAARADSHCFWVTGLQMEASGASSIRVSAMAVPPTDSVQGSLSPVLPGTCYVLSFSYWSDVLSRVVFVFLHLVLVF